MLHIIVKSLEFTFIWKQLSFLILMIWRPLKMTVQLIWRALSLHLSCVFPDWAQAVHMTGVSWKCPEQRDPVYLTLFCWLLPLIGWYLSSFLINMYLLGEISLHLFTLSLFSHFKLSLGFYFKIGWLSWKGCICPNIWFICKQNFLWLLEIYIICKMGTIVMPVTLDSLKDWMS